MAFLEPKVEHGVETSNLKQVVLGNEWLWAQQGNGLPPHSPGTEDRMLGKVKDWPTSGLCTCVCAVPGLRGAVSGD
jgi:hypothetical protein